MKLRFFCIIQSTADCALVALRLGVRSAQCLRVWAWTRATRENLRTCNTRALGHDIAE